MTGIITPGPGRPGNKKKLKGGFPLLKTSNTLITGLAGVCTYVQRIILIDSHKIIKKKINRISADIFEKRRPVYVSDNIVLLIYYYKSLSNVTF